MGIVVTPTLDWLREQAAACEKRLLISSPYVNNGIKEITGYVSDTVNRVLVTKVSLTDFALNASSLESLCDLARDGVKIQVLGGLHAKVYIFDNYSALVTSANATAAGLNSNWECGIETSDKATISKLTKAVLGGFGAPKAPWDISAKELEALRESVAAIKATVPPALKTKKEFKPPSEPEFSIKDESQLLKGFAGWRRLTLEGVLALPRGIFRLNDVYRICLPMAARRYPNNTRAKEKLRQQLQELRDLEIIEFLGRGTYRRTLDS
jgi:hypothetical protein